MSLCQIVCLLAAPLADVFLHGLADHIKDMLIACDRLPLLDGVIELAIQVDLHMQACGCGRQSSTPFVIAGSQGFLPLPPPTPLLPPPLVLPPQAVAPKPGVEPMQLGRTSLNPGERRRRHRADFCMYCGGRGHFISTRPVKGWTHL